MHPLSLSLDMNGDSSMWKSYKLGHAPKACSQAPLHLVEIKKYLRYGSMANYFTTRKLAAEPTQNKHE